MKALLPFIILLLLFPMAYAHGNETPDETQTKGLSLELILVITMLFAIVFALFLNWVADLQKKSIVGYMIGATAVILLLDYVYLKYVLYA